MHPETGGSKQNHQTDGKHADTTEAMVQPTNVSPTQVPQQTEVPPNSRGRTQAHQPAPLLPQQRGRAQSADSISLSHGQREGISIHGAHNPSAYDNLTGRQDPGYPLPPQAVGTPYNTIGDHQTRGTATGGPGNPYTQPQLPQQDNSGVNIPQGSHQSPTDRGGLQTTIQTAQMLSGGPGRSPYGGRFNITPPSGLVDFQPAVPHPTRSYSQPADTRTTSHFIKDILNNAPRKIYDPTKEVATECKGFTYTPGLRRFLGAHYKPTEPGSNGRPKHPQLFGL